MIDPKRIIELWDKPPYGLVNGNGFHLMTGAQAHEVAVGPVHAGVIEPGHFRFQCLGEDVRNLEISLGYQHRGAEKLIVEAESDIRRLAIAQTVAGDSSIAATLACSAALKIGSECQTPSASSDEFPIDNFSLLTSHFSLLLELERIANHVGDLGALAGDVAYLPTASFCGRIRGEYLNMTALFTGNRFGRVLPNLSNFSNLSNLSSLLDKFVPWFDKTKRECFHALDLLFSETSAIERFEGAGVVSEENARAIGMVGVAARASGIKDTMGGWPVVGGGDVLARARQRYEELKVSHRRIEKIVSRIEHKELKEDLGWDVLKVHEVEDETGFYRIAVVDAWRGELVHAARFAAGAREGARCTEGAREGARCTEGAREGARCTEYRIFDPSYFNWFGLSLALRGEQISNFPICNKSFNLSYCGVDK